MAGSEAGRARVLIVDDDPDTRAITAAALQDGYDVVCAATGREALGHIHARVPDAIVVDVMLGSESGWELVRALQADPRCATTPVIIVSGRGDLEPPSGVRPCAAYLHKPCRMAELRLLLRRLLVPPHVSGGPCGTAAERRPKTSSSSDP